MHCDKLQDDDTNSSTIGGGSTESESAGWQYRQDTQIRRVLSIDKETAMPWTTSHPFAPCTPSYSYSMRKITTLILNASVSCSK
jgi:hypothetical protein